VKKFLLLGLYVFVQFTQAAIEQQSIHSLEVDQNGSLNFIRMKNGEVIFADELNSSQKAQVKKSMQQTQKPLKPMSTGTFSTHLDLSSVFDFTPTVIDFKEAQEIFKNFNSNFKRSSECSNRAHVWAHEEFKNKGTKSMKAFIFFTSSYINRHRFKWWFHVAPAFEVNHNSAVESYIFDFVFNHQPIKLQEWKNHLVYSKRDCKMDGTFTEYDKRADQSQDCYLFMRPMYYWMPGDLSVEEIYNTKKNGFIPSEISAAYTEAFTNINGVE
jgi:hypothetical protein